MTDADSQSIANKVRYLMEANVVQATTLAIPLDPDLVELYSRVTGDYHLLSPEEVLLVQVIRLLRGTQNDGSNNPGNPTDPGTVGGGGTSPVGQT